jgi:FkbM family methyltransferase
MGKSISSAYMRFHHAPDVESAKRMLKDIANMDITCAPRKVDKPLVIYGAGELGRMAKSYFDRLHIPVRYVVDRTPAPHRKDPFWRGVDIVNPSDVSASDHKESLLAVCVVKAQFSQLHQEVCSQGWADAVPFYDIAEAYRDRHPLGNGWMSGKLDSTDIENIESVLSGWHDDASRAHHLQFIAWRALREDWVFDDAGVNTDDRFFIPEILSLLRNDEVFCDLGAHHAEVILRFLKVTSNNFSKVLAIEPDTENIARLHTTLGKLEPEILKKIRVLNSAVAAQAGIRNFFQGLDYASQLSDLGLHPMEVTTIDNLQLAPTFLKLHLEGGELEALTGGLQVLKKYRPIIAATTYHNIQGLWELPKWLMEALSEYKFHIRLHGWCGTGAVVYGIPNERIELAK